MPFSNTMKRTIETTAGAMALAVRYIQKENYPDIVSSLHGFADLRTALNNHLQETGISGASLGETLDSLIEAALCMEGYVRHGAPYGDAVYMRGDVPVEDRLARILQAYDGVSSHCGETDELESMAYAGPPESGVYVREILRRQNVENHHVLVENVRRETGYPGFTVAHTRVELSPLIMPETRKKVIGGLYALDFTRVR